ncbi:MAG: hypothetical protein JSS75_11795 [Bacteroidetes bacterium]|nr:hypothetical protein [Bacteroidota bacterium]
MKSRSFRASALVAVMMLASMLGGCNTPNGDGQNPSSVQPMAAHIQLPQADVDRVTDIKARHEDELLALPSVVGAGVGVNDDGSPAIVVFASDHGVRGVPQNIEGVRTRTEYVGEVRALQFTGTYRAPMWSGVSVGNDNECAAGTIGCVVKNNVNNTFYLLSNNHVFARENSAKIGEKIDQPGRYEFNCGPSGQVGTLNSFVKIVMKRNASNVVDCAIANIGSGINPTSQMALSSYTPTTNARNATVGMTVKKTGRTTGLTGGTVSAVNVTINVQYSHGTARFINQVYVTPGTFSAAGDSGSLIVEASSNDPVALLFAGGSSGTFGNPITSVLISFGVSVVPF